MKKQFSCQKNFLHKKIPKRDLVFISLIFFMPSFGEGVCTVCHEKRSPRPKVLVKESCDESLKVGYSRLDDLTYVMSLKL